jgi:predicted DCC family thiol-disulfide oxidoreductase YuxK
MDEQLRLTFIYDGDCLLCRRSVHWLESQRTRLKVTAVAAGRPDSVLAYGDIPGYGHDAVVAASDGRIWVGPPDAYLVLMWAVRRTRALSYVLSLPPLKSLAGRAFQLVVGNRHAIGKLARPSCDPLRRTATG